MEEILTTEFNSGIAKLKRIDNIRQNIIIARRESNTELWFKEILSWRNEMDYKFKEEEGKEADKLESNIQKILKTHRGELTTLSNLLTRYERLLGKLENKYGFGMLDKADGRYALGGR